MLVFFALPVVLLNPSLGSKRSAYDMHVLKSILMQIFLVFPYTLSLFFLLLLLSISCTACNILHFAFAGLSLFCLLVVGWFFFFG